MPVAQRDNIVLIQLCSVTARIIASMFSLVTDETSNHHFFVLVLDKSETFKVFNKCSISSVCTGFRQI